MLDHVAGLTYLEILDLPLPTQKTFYILCQNLKHHLFTFLILFDFDKKWLLKRFTANKLSMSVIELLTQLCGYYRADISDCIQNIFNAFSSVTIEFLLLILSDVLITIFGKKSLADFLLVFSVLQFAHWTVLPECSMSFLVEHLTHITSLLASMTIMRSRISKTAENAFDFSVAGSLNCCFSYYSSL